MEAQLQGMVRSDEVNESKSKRGGKRKLAKQNDGGADDVSDGLNQPVVSLTSLGESVTTQTNHHQCLLIL